jgi:phage tail-like protein
VSETKATSQGPCSVSHVADRYRHYPGEDVVLSTRVRALKALPSYTLRLAIPTGMVPGDTLAPGYAVPQLRVEPNVRYLFWQVEGPIEAGACYDYEVTCRIEPTQQDLTLRTSARIRVPRPEGESYVAEETIPIIVRAKGAYLHFLPAVYHRDELMGRFLMLFESFWDPIEKQVAQIPAYLDPRMTPRELLPWLASWFSLELDEYCPDAQRRDLVRQAMSLYRRRGTRTGLQDHLRAYTGEKVEVIEHRANNFVLGTEGKLGPGIALGTQNRPHTFTVVLETQPDLPGDEKGARNASERIAAIKRIIDAEKPAHTGYTLRVK